MTDITQKLTKIVATIGPSSDSPEVIEKLIQSGVNIFRFNTKHGTVEWHEERIKRAQKVADRLGVVIGILLDLQGPEIRLETKGKLPVPIEKGQIISITPSFTSEEDIVVIPHELVFDTLKKGDQVLIDDGSVELEVVSCKDNVIRAKAIDDGQIAHRKGVNLPGVNIDLPSLIHEDLKKLDMVTTVKVDFIALSFSRTKKDIEILRKQMAKRGIDAKVVAKIESMEALNNIDELVEATDAIMVARGDLGVEVPIEQLAFWQKTIIRKCRVHNKPVITATQMLESMTHNARPTRAEATDVANAVLDGTDAIMLSGETANGKFPVKAVQAMAKIASYNEMTRSHIEFKLDPQNQTDLVVNAIRQLLNQHVVSIKFILCFTYTGNTAMSISRLRPKVPIIAVTEDQKTVEELTISYGVEGIKYRYPKGEFKLPNPVINNLIEEGRLKKGDTIVVVHGQSVVRDGSANAVALYTV
jgi:pyruvate kinase